MDPAEFDRLTRGVARQSRRQLGQAALGAVAGLGFAFLVRHDDGVARRLERHKQHKHHCLAVTDACTPMAKPACCSGKCGCESGVTNCSCRVAKCLATGATGCRHGFDCCTGVCGGAIGEPRACMVVT